MSDELRRAFQSANLPQPPVPGELMDNLQRLSDWNFCTRESNLSAYDVEEVVAHTLQRRGEDFLMIGHTGYGVSNWHLYVYFSHGPLTVFLQLAWGGANHDPEECRIEIRKSFDQLDRLVVMIDQLASENPGERLVVIQTSIGDSRWGWLPDQEIDADDMLAWNYAEEPLVAATTSSDQSGLPDETIDPQRRENSAV